MPKNNKLVQLNAQHRCLLDLMRTGSFEWKTLVDNIRAQNVVPENWLTVRNMLTVRIAAGVLRRDPDIHRERYITVGQLEDPVALATTDVLAPARQALLDVIMQANGATFRRGEADGFWEVCVDHIGKVTLEGYARDAYGADDILVDELALSDLAYLAEAAAKEIAKRRV